MVVARDKSRTVFMARKKGRGFDLSRLRGREEREPRTYGCVQTHKNNTKAEITKQQRVGSQPGTHGTATSIVRVVTELITAIRTDDVILRADRESVGAKHSHHLMLCFDTITTTRCNVVRW